MLRQFFLCGTFLLGASAFTAQSQKVILAHPEAIAGRWETADGESGMVGMNISLSTQIDGAPSSLMGRPHSLSYFTVALFQRHGAEVEPLGFTFFTYGPDESMPWDGRTLEVHSSPGADVPVTNIRLDWHENLQSWTGRFERGQFRNNVTLRRPRNTQASPFVGTWFSRRDLGNNCVHIAQARDGVFTAWSDDIVIPGRMRYANGIQPPKDTRENYGEIGKARLVSADAILVELRAFTALCCSHPFTAAIAADGQTLEGEWPAGPNQAYRSVVWTKMAGESCVEAASSP